MPGRLNLFQRMMLRWRDMHPYNAVHVVVVPKPFGEVPVAERIGRLLEANGLTGLVLDRPRGRYDYAGGPADVILEALPGGVDPLGVACREVERQLNLPFPHASRQNPFRFFAVTDAQSFHLGLAYDHFVAGGESIALLLNAIAQACAGTPTSAAAPDLYPGTYRGLFLRHPALPARGMLNLPQLVAASRRSFRPRYRRGEDAHNGFAYFRIAPDEAAALQRTAKSWGVTLTDLFLAALLLALSPLAAERHREPRRRELAVASIVNTREDFVAEPGRVFGQFLASFSVAHPVPAGIGLRELARDVNASTARIKRDKLYLQTIVALGLSYLMWPILSGPRRAGFYAKYHPVWGGVTPLNVDALWGKSGRDDVRTWEYFRAVPTGPLCPLVFAFTTAQHAMHVGVSYRTAAFSRAMVDDVTAAFRRCIGVEKGPPVRRLSAFFGLLLLLAVAGCATPPAGRPAAISQSELEQHAALRSTAVEPAVAERILAIDPDRVSDADVRTALARGPTPRIINVHGGIYPVHLVMESFARFLVGMGYPEAKIRHPGDGRLSHSPYESSAEIAGTLAWYYEREAAMPMMIGHSQGGIQAVKVLYELNGAYGERIQVWNPVTNSAEDRVTIVDPFTAKPRPVVGLRVGYVSVVGAGGAALLLPNQWSMAGRLRTIPDTVEEFTGYSLGVDMIAWDFSSAASDFRANGTAQVRNVQLPAHYSHVTVALTSHLARSKAMRDWLNAYRPGEAGSVPEGEGSTDNALWAADVWFHVKRHWALEAQKVIREQRALARMH